MSYQVLARKWRPQSFADMVGQVHVVKALSHALDNAQLHHAYLFTGTRGVGKTTLARIIAKCLNCEQKISAQPCGQCEACQSISQGQSFDVFEIDAASRTKVEDTRELLDNVPYRPAHLRYKVYIIDEVHMLSNHSFNALLKTLEEPPPHVVFILATTNPEKLPMTILSRCLQFHLKPLSPELIESRLSYILEQENIEYETAAITFLAQAAKGSLRDALSLLDQAIAHGSGQVVEDQVSAMLGITAQDILLELADIIIQGDAESLMQMIQRMAEDGRDFNQVLSDLASLLHDLALLQFIPELSMEADYQAKLKHLSNLVSKEQVQLYYQIAINGSRDLHLAPSLRQGFEMALLRMLAFNLLSQSTPEETTSSAGGQLPTAAVAVKTHESASSSSASKSTDSKNTKIKLTESADKASDGQWDQLVKQLKLSGMAAQLARHCSLIELSDRICTLLLDAKQAPLLTETSKNRLHEALKSHLNNEIQLKVELKGNLSNTPHKRAVQAKATKVDQAYVKLKRDETLQSVLKTFNTELEVKNIEIDDKA